MTTTIRIIAAEKMSDRAIGKLGEAELYFGGFLDGLRLIGFGIWERRTGNGRNVTFPARQYSVNGERRSFALLRPADAANVTAQDRIRIAILDAFERTEHDTANRSTWMYADDGTCLEAATVPQEPTPAAEQPPTTTPALF